MFAAVAITLQPVRDEDTAFLRALYASTRTDLAAMGLAPAQLEGVLQMQFQAQHANYAAAYPGARHEVILEDGKPVGRIYVWRSGQEVRLVDIALLPAARGRGIGTELLRDLIAQSEGERLPVRLQVVVTNPARRLYLRLGFRRTGGDGVYDEMEWSSQPRPQEP